jgi:hypothetical protein
VTTATGIINTIIGSGTAGYGGETLGLGGRGVVIKAAVAAGGPNYLPVEGTVNVYQSHWNIDSYGTSQTTAGEFTYRVFQTAPGLGSFDRMAADTTFTPTATAPVTLAPLTIARNATSVTGTAIPTGISGSGSITIPRVGNILFESGQSAVIVVAPAAPP